MKSWSQTEEDMRFFAPPTEEEQKEAHEYYEACMSVKTIADKKDLVKKSIKDQVLSGHLNPLEFYRQAKVIADVIEDLKKKTLTYLIALTPNVKNTARIKLL